MAGIQLSAAIRSGTDAAPGSSRMRVMTRLFCSNARSSSIPHSCESSERGVSTNTTVSAAETASRISSRHFAVGGMSSQSTQTSRLRSAS